MWCIFCSRLGWVLLLVILVMVLLLLSFLGVVVWCDWVDVLLLYNVGYGDVSWLVLV